MKRVLLLSALLTAGAIPAMAADLPAKAPRAPVMAPVVENWNGFYIGANGGYSWGRSETTVNYFALPGGAPIVAPAGSVTGANFDMRGGVAGGQIGYNWQFSPSWVFGLEADAQWSGQTGSAAFLCSATVAGGPCFPGSTFLPPGATGTAVAIEQDLEWFGTFRGRLGWLVSPSVMVYATGGLAYGEVQTTAAIASVTPAGLAIASASSASDTRFGWTAGGGIEALFGGNWSGKLEYLYMDLGTVSTTVGVTTGPGPVGVGANISSRVTDSILRAGINYRFSPGPVVARY